ncbi:MAG: DUF2797 domain-containing protein [Streptosporangiaceae bacterium]
MTTPPGGWLFTGLHWESARPVLTACPLPDKAGGMPGPEVSRPAAPGSPVSWTLHGPRQCTGAWTGTTRRPCPAAARVAADGTDAQCPACAAADRGRQIARDAALGDDGRDYLLYLAWFGTSLVKIGLTAADRGRDRLLEQGAITFTPLAAGPYTPIRQAERLTSAAGLAAERISSRAKITAWWHLPPPAERAAQLTAARDHIAGQVTWPGRVRLLPCAVTDQAADFGLNQNPPGAYTEVTGFGDPAALGGQILLAAGCHLLLWTASGPLLADMRRAAGRVIRPADMPARPGGLSLTLRVPPRDHDDRQPSLF